MRKLALWNLPTGNTRPVGCQKNKIFFLGSQMFPIQRPWEYTGSVIADVMGGIPSPTESWDLQDILTLVENFNLYISEWFEPHRSHYSIEKNFMLVIEEIENLCRRYGWNFSVKKYKKKKVFGWTMDDALNVIRRIIKNLKKFLMLKLL